MRKSLDNQADDGSMYDLSSLESLGCHMFFGEVDIDSSYAACEFILKSNLLSCSTDALTLVLNTVGGEAGDGFAIIDMMENSRLPIATVGVGTIASMGVLLLSAGTKGLRTLTQNSEVMAHQFSAYFGGKQHELIAAGVSFKMLEERFFKHFLRHSNMSQKQIKDVLFAPSDRFLTPAECLKYGLIDRVAEGFDVPAPVKKIRVGRKVSPK